MEIESMTKEENIGEKKKEVYLDVCTEKRR
jgi:hypothetical protein